MSRVTLWLVLAVLWLAIIATLVWVPRIAPGHPVHGPERHPPGRLAPSVSDHASPGRASP